MADSPDGTEGGRATRTKDIVIQVEEADKQTPGENKRKTRFADEDTAKNVSGEKTEAKKAKVML